MSETAPAVATPATATDSPAQQPVATPAPEAAEDEEKRYPWLPSRLGRERKQVTKQLGVESIDEAKALVEEARKLKAERLSETERMQARIKELEALTKDAEELRGSVSSQAAEAMASLTPEQREAIEDLAGDSPTRQLKAIAKLRPTWKQQAASAPLPAPASTSPATATAPAPTASSTENHLATWERLRSSHPIAAAYYLDQHQVEITEARKARK